MRSLTSAELAKRTGFTCRHIPRIAAQHKIPDALRKPSGSWKFPVTHRLRAWIFFYQIRNRLLRKDRSFRETEVLQAWGTNWKIALVTFDFFQRPIWGLGVVSFEGETFPLGPGCGWRAVEAAVYCGAIPKRDGTRITNRDGDT